VLRWLSLSASRVVVAWGRAIAPMVLVVPAHLFSDGRRSSPR
jgi:hypothetical protein